MREPVDVPLYRWPDAARFGRVVPKTKFYEHSKVTNAVRERFVAEVQRITWAFKLADTTIHLAGTKSVPEIQVFQVDAKKDDVSELVLEAIDKAVTSPIIFEVRRGEPGADQGRLVAAHKQVGTGTPRVGSYFTTRWRPADAERAQLPAAIDLPSLYAALLAPLLPIASQPGEDAATVAARVEAAQKLEREIATLQRKLRNEPQLNRKVDLRRTLKTKQTMLAAMTGPTT
jgi:hypothetical protein